jgi:hypothetical protein
MESFNSSLSVLSTSEIENISSSRKLTSSVHEYCRTIDSLTQENLPLRDDKNRRLYYCAQESCKYNANSTSAFRTHLRSKHKITIQLAAESRTTSAIEQFQLMYQALQQEGTSMELEGDILKRFIDKKLVEKALLKLIIVRRLPFAIVESKEFQAFCMALNKESLSAIPTSHNTITSRIAQLFPEGKDIVRKALQSAQTNIHLAVDIWTSPNRYLYLAICGSFVDVHSQFQNVLLGLRTTQGHSGLNQWLSIKPVLEEFGILRKIGTIVGDNSGTNDTLCRTISEYLSSEERIDWNPTHQRIRCQGHILNLVIQAFFFTSEDEKLMASYDKEDDIPEEERTPDQSQKKRQQHIREKMGNIGKLHNIVIHIRSSPIRTNEFKQKAGRSIPLDNRTRWNSWFNMLSVALNEEKVKPALHSYIEKYVAEGSLDVKDVISSKQWNELRTMKDFLEIFSEATNLMQGKQATIELVLEAVDLLRDYFISSLVCRTRLFLISIINFSLENSIASIFQGSNTTSLIKV